MASRTHVEIDRARIKELTEREAAKLERPHAGLAGVLRARAAEPRRRRRFLVPVPRPVADLPLAREGRPGVGRRRQRVPRLPQRLRLDGAGARPRRDLEGRDGPDRARDAFRRADRGRHRRRRGARAPLGPPEVALRQLRLRGHDGRDPDRARRDRARHDRQDLRLLPRPSRLRDGLARRRLRGDRRPLRPAVDPVRARHPAGRRRHDDRRAVQRRRGDGAPHRAADRGGPRAGLRDHGGGDDEPRRRAPRARLPRGRARDHPQARDHADLRRGQDRALHRRRRCCRAVRRHARHRHPREGARGRSPVGRDRRHRPRCSSSSRRRGSSRSGRTTATRSRWRRPARTCSR